MKNVRRLLILAACGCTLIAPASAAAFTVYAASSLKRAFQQITPSPSYSFGGSDVLAFQIESGAAADVFASAAPIYADKLVQKHLCGTPVVFATNTLTLVVPTANPKQLRSATDLAKGGLRLAIGGPNVPLGSYTRSLLGRLHLAAALRGNTVSTYTKASDVTATIALGSADAGFVYTTDWLANRSKLSRIDVAAAAQPPIRYVLCTVTRSGVDVAAASSFARQITSGRGRKILRDNGFGLPPKP